MERMDFNGGWIFQGKEITLPHDAMLYEKRDEKSPGADGGAFYYGGVYRYEKNFYVPKEWEGQCVRLEFEGVYRNATVTLNGQRAGYHAYGYVNFFVDCSGYLHYGAENQIVVEADNSRLPNSRWYSGSGIYRPVWLTVAPPDHIEDVRISTVGIDPAVIRVKVQMTEQSAVPHILICDGDERDAVGTTGEIAMESRENAAGATGEIMAEADGFACDITLEGAELWEEQHPRQYVCRVVYGEKDRWEGKFGIRMLEWNQTGFYVNGKSVKLRGGCVHHDNGILGACAYEEAEERRVRRMKEAGYNAIRSSHNPCSESFLRACDKYGMYLIDEMWDMWYERKNQYDYALDFEEHYREDLERTIDRDFNHPSVIMYSVGNENLEPYDERGLGMLQSLIDICHERDDSRPVTMGLNPTIVHGAKSGKGLYREAPEGEAKKAGGSMLFNILLSMFHGLMEKFSASDSVGQTIYPIIEKLDIVGYNYAQKRYVPDHEKYPHKLFYGSETMPYHIAQNWKLVEEHPFVCGDFCWTAWDYLGEAGLGSWSYRAEAAGFKKKFPWKLAETGAIDLLGDVGAEAAYAKAVWRKDSGARIMATPPNHPKERLHRGYWRGTNAVPSWSWQGCDGNKTSVEVIGSGAEAELFVNERSIGKKKLKDCKAVFRTVYRTGEITAKIYDESGDCISQAKMSSAKGPLRLAARPEEDGAIKAGKVAFIDVALVGENGAVESNADRQLRVSVEGGELLGFGSACPCTVERFVDGCYTTHMGRAMAAVRRQEPGTLRFCVSDGTIAAETSVRYKG